jgi:hypothetical protein
MVSADRTPSASGRLARARSGARSLLAACADLIVPPCCLVCRAPLSAHHLLCATCWREVNFIRPPLCDVLGMPLPFDTGGRMVSAAAVAQAPAYGRARAVAHFSGAMRTLIHQFKYADRHDARALFGRWLAEAGRDLITGVDVVVPVPLSRGGCCHAASTRPPSWPRSCRAIPGCPSTCTCCSGRAPPPRRSA